MCVYAMQQAIEVIERDVREDDSDRAAGRWDRGIALVALREALAKAAAQADVPPPDELSPPFTDTARAALLWVLWHHQGGSSPVGQPIRFALGMGQHEPLNDHQVRNAQRWAALTRTRSTTAAVAGAAR